jgi:flagellin
VIQFPVLSGPAANPPFPTISQIERQQSRLFGQLASGNRLTSTAIDPAALAIDETLISQVNGLDQAQSNTGDALSLLSTAGGALNSQQAVLQQERTLAVQAGDAALGPSDLAIIQGQVQQLSQGLDQIGQQTQFNGIALLNGSAGTLNVQSGPNPGQQTPVNLPATNSQALGIGSVDLTATAGEQAGLSQIDRAIEATTADQATLGAGENGLAAASNDAALNQENQAAARSLLAGTNIAQASTQLSQSLLEQRFSLFALQQQAGSFGLTGALLGA